MSVIKELKVGNIYRVPAIDCMDNIERHYIFLGIKNDYAVKEFEDFCIEENDCYIFYNLTENEKQFWYMMKNMDNFDYYFDQEIGQ